MQDMILCYSATMLAQFSQPVSQGNPHFFREISRSSRESTGGIEPWIVMLILIFIFSLAVFLTFWLRRRAEGVVGDSPQQLFASLCRRLELSVPHQEFLHRVSRDLNLEHPTVLLLSPPLFDQHVASWTKVAPTQPKAPTPPRAQDVLELRQHLFPQNFV